MKNTRRIADAGRRTESAPHHLDTSDLVTFLTGLKNNNQREWFEAHRSEFERLREQFLQVLAEVISRSGASFAPEVKALDPRKCLFRIFRDTRFSKDKSPYKTHFSALLPVTKREDVRAGYYIHVDADDRLMAGACAHSLPPAALLQARHYIAEHHEELHGVVAQLKKKGLTELDGERQKIVPRGFPPDHPASEYLKHKSFKMLAVESARKLDKAPGAHIAGLLRRSHPFADFIRRTLV